MLIDILRTELLTDPLARGYSGMTPDQAAASLNTSNRTRNRVSMSGDEAFQATTSAEWTSLSAANKPLWLSFCARSVINPSASANVALVTALFGAGSATLAALNAARQESITRATELGLPRVEPGHVMEARR